jgi:hypothetical protein
MHKRVVVVLHSVMHCLRVIIAPVTRSTQAEPP